MSTVNFNVTVATNDALEAVYINGRKIVEGHHMTASDLARAINEAGIGVTIAFETIEADCANDGTGYPEKEDDLEPFYDFDDDPYGSFENER